MKAFLGATATLLIFSGGCFYSLDVEGKACNYSDHPCPAGYSCIPAGDGGGICRQQADAGDGSDGGDVGPCVEGQKSCVAGQPEKILVCESGFWKESSCTDGKYCYWVGPQFSNSDCVDPCQKDDECRTQDFCNTDSHHCEPKGDCSPPGEKRCLFKAGYDAVEECDGRTGRWIETPCGPEQYCHERYLRCLSKCTSNEQCQNLPDSSNPEPNSCDLGESKCRYLSFCIANSGCPQGFQCVTGKEGLGVCVKQPSSVSSNDLSCFKTPVSPDNGSSTTCAIEGDLLLSISSSDVPKSTKTIGLQLEVHRLENVLRGDLAGPIAQVTATQVGGYGHFETLDAVPTKTALVFRVLAGRGQGGDDFVDTFTFGYYLRSDDCEAASGKVRMDIPAMESSVFLSYTAAGLSIKPDPRRGLIIARLRDCTPNRIEKATVAVSMNAQQTFYILTGLLPDPQAESTDRLGYFGATNAMSIEGLLGVLVNENTSFVFLGPYPLRVFPGSASMVLVERPRQP
jgi:hypothetical protein